jgi:hypothetical protein
LEKLGIPTVTVATSALIGLARDTTVSLGAPDQSFVVVQHPMQTLTPEEIWAKADRAFPDILKGATQWKPNLKQARPMRPVYPAETFKFKGAETDVTALYYKNGWSDGFPIVAPTPERVKKMLTGTTRKPNEVIGVPPPRMGILTVELAAVHAVMAGAKPQYLPVILTAVEALLEPRHQFRGATTTTNPVAIFIAVNGPIVKELGIQYGTGALAPGPYSESNATIGRAVNLIMDIVGGSKPPSPDKSTLGSPASYTMVLGENEDENPWELLNEQQGSKRGISTVTVYETRSLVNFQIKGTKTGKDLLTIMAKGMAGVSGIAEDGFTCEPESRELMILCPQHANFLHKEGWTLKRIKEYLYENARISLEDYRTKWAGDVPNCRNQESNPTVVPGPDSFQIMVAGGEGPHSLYLETNRYIPITKEIKK